MSKIKTKLKSIIEERDNLLKIAKNYPLALARLWVPHCHRWDGLGDKSKREPGCKQPMEMLSPGIYHCEKCNITEKRTCQREAIANLGTTATALFGGNRSGKSQSGAQLAVAVASGRDAWWVRQWLKINNLPDRVVPNRNPSTVIASALSYGDAIAYIRPKLESYLPKNTRLIRWNAQDRATALLENGGKIYSLSADSGREKYQGQSCELVWLDEEHPEPIFQESLMRTIDSGISNGVFLSMTPLKGFTWPADLFIQNPSEGFVYHKITGLDNPYISSGKMMKTIGHMSEESKASRLHGDFTNQAGLVYAEFDRNIHVIDHIDISNRDKYDLFLSIDFGCVNPFVCLAIASDGENIFVIDEYFQTERTTIHNGKALQVKFHKLKPFDYVIADPESKDARMILAKECNLPNHPAPKSGKYGVSESINLVKQKLSLNAENKPTLFVTKKCKNLLMEFRKYRWAKTNNGKDKPKKESDHGMDALRYMVSWLDRYNSHF